MKMYQFTPTEFNAILAGLDVLEELVCVDLNELGEEVTTMMEILEAAQQVEVEV